MRNNILSILITISLLTNTINPQSLTNYCTTKNVLCFFMGSSIAFYVGKSLYNMYFDYYLPHQSFLQYYRNAFKQIDNSINYYTIYTQNAQLNDWELKGEIYANNQAIHPFMDYYQSLCSCLSKLNSAIKNVQKSLHHINNRKCYIINNSTTFATKNQPLKDLENIEDYGISLEKQLKKITFIIATLKNRIASFHEYQEDYHHWLYKEEQYEELHSYECSHSNETETIKPQQTPEKDAFDCVEQQIIQFNLDYY